ncbi:helix-turn-helix transcriptional regulator [Roseburia hominis]
MGKYLHKNKNTAFVDYPCGDFLKEVRKSLKLSQAVIAQDIGISQIAYSGWERGARVPRRKEYQRIVAGLDHVEEQKTLSLSEL